jgi:hypothetical protein
VGSADAGHAGELVNPRHVADADGPGPPKRCTICGEVKALAEFGWVTAGGKRYRCPRCRGCDAARNRARRRRAALMARKRRKTLIVCRPCHDYIHANPVANAA